MTRFYGTIDTLEFDSAGYTRAMREALEVQFRQAARAFVRAAILKIPVETGMARGSFKDIGRFLNVQIPINPTRSGKYYPPNGGAPIPKTPEAGAALSTPPDQIIKWDDANRIAFEFESQVFHYTLQEFFRPINSATGQPVGSPTAPWQSMIAGRVAFRNEMRSLRKRLPKIKSFMTRTSITFGNGGYIVSKKVRLRQQEKVK